MARNLADLIPAIFTGPDGRPLTEDQIRSRQAVARSLIQSASDTSPNAGGWASIMAKGVQGFVGGYQNRQADRGADAALKVDSDLSSALLGSLGGGTTASSAISSGMPLLGAAGELSATSPAISLPQSADANYIREGLIARGLPGHVADGFIANFQDESGLNPGINEAKPLVPGSRGGFGLYQLTGPRRVEYEAFAKNKGVDPSNVDAQLDFLVQEGQGSERGAFAKILAAPDTATAAQAIVNDFLRPAPEHRVERTARYAGLQSAPQSAATAYAAPAPIPVTSAPLAAIDQMATAGDPMVGAQQNISPVAQALVAPMKGDRLGDPAAISQQSFDERSAPPVDTMAVPEIYSQPADFAQPQVAPVQQDPAQISPQAAPQSAPSIPQMRAPSVPPLDPAVVKALSSPYASPQTKQVASALLQQHQQQVQAAQEQGLKIQEQQQALQQRQSVASRLGIDPTLAADDDAWKSAISAQSTGGGIVNAGDGNLYNSRTGQWITAPNQGNKNFRQATADEVKQFGTNGQVGPDGRFYPVTPPQGTALSVGPNGEVTFNQGAGVKPLTEGQSKDAFFTTRMSAALPTLEANENALLSLAGKGAEALPMNLGNYAQTEEYQLARDAGRDFVTAYLRKDSGAALTPAEEKMYGELLLPQPGDKAATIELKKQRRQIAIEAIKSGMPPQATDGVIKALKAVPGSDKPMKPAVINGYQIEEIQE